MHYNTHTHTQKKLKPCLVASYDIRPGNGEGLISLLHEFVTDNVSPITHTFKHHLKTQLQPMSIHTYQC